ncbi:SGNH hydrolase-type esterase domain-containing protein [Podospora fimiseda]|uniref:SGNH hydrolase-type esterase domain-containing protein n=1 Tax=Podospora fimiseda TaxID=252190 RepID=A0AAN7BQV6_9PEZI|nr:SGNH hydrolase-type esterase domain-containing protein [Podospora fimiseda]
MFSLFLLSSLSIITITSASAIFKPRPSHHQQKPLFISSSSQFRFNSFVSLGDSYSSGIGTPPPPSPAFNPKNPCRLGTGAYPYLLSQSQNRSSSSSFKWLSCAGSKTFDLLTTSPDSQISAINTSVSTLSFATLSIGGNDLDFFALLNACVFRFYGPFTSETCFFALKNAEESIFSSSPSETKKEFELRIRLVLIEIFNKIRWEFNPGFFITVTGYAAFFNEETDLCDGISFGVWKGPGTESLKLTKEIRKRMNKLVRGANSILKKVVEDVGRKKVIFVDYNSVFEGHRFCEAGVKEPDYERVDTWFFLPGGKDINGRGEVYEHEEEQSVIEEDDPIVDPLKCEEVIEKEKRNDWGERAICDMFRAKWRDPELEVVVGDSEGGVRVAPGDSMWYTPTYYGKKFHPRSVRHEAIRDKIFKVWADHGIGR